jgi:hypothetical protein
MSNRRVPPAKQTKKQPEKQVNATQIVLTTICVAIALFVGMAIGCNKVADQQGVEDVKRLYSFPSGGSGSDSIASGGLYEGTALYDITLSNKAHLIVLYDNTTNSSSIVPWPDPTSPETGYLYVSPLDRDAVLRRIAEREEKDEQAKKGANTYSFRLTTDSQETTTTDNAVETRGTVSVDDND